jgi:O-methyltransferase involved in polyketide biosynthesis
MELSHVSRTALFTLLCRVIGEEREQGAFADPMARLCLERLMASSSEDEKEWIHLTRKRFAGASYRDVRPNIRRVMFIDEAARSFIAEHPGCTVVSLGCGLDTRYWRIGHDRCRYVELDLPEMIRLKREILGAEMDYETIEGSALDPGWVDQVTRNGNAGFLIIAEGLFYYLPAREVDVILAEIGRRFHASRIIMDVAWLRYTRGIWKRIIQLEARLSLGLDLSLRWGVGNIHELEARSPGFRVVGEGPGTVGRTVIASIGAE